MYLMGIDVGTTGVKTILISAEGELVSEANSSYPVHSPQTNWFEQDPVDWWDGTVVSIKQMLKDSSVDGSRISGIGLSGMYHGLVLLGKDHEVLRPSILWNDQRTGKQSDHIIESCPRSNSSPKCRVSQSRCLFLNLTCLGLQE